MDGDLDIAPEARTLLVQRAQGDARVALNGLEGAVTLARNDSATRIQVAHVEQALQLGPLRYDKSGEEHYNLISAFIKSLRGSDPDAAVYWMVRMIEAGEDPLFIAGGWSSSRPRTSATRTRRPSRWRWPPRTRFTSWGCRRGASP